MCNKLHKIIMGIKKRNKKSIFDHNFSLGTPSFLRFWHSRSVLSNVWRIRTVQNKCLIGWNVQLSWTHWLVSIELVLWNNSFTITIDGRNDKNGHRFNNTGNKHDDLISKILIVINFIHKNCLEKKKKYIVTHTNRRVFRKLTIREKAASMCTVLG